MLREIAETIFASLVDVALHRWRQLRIAGDISVLVSCCAFWYGIRQQQAVEGMSEPYSALAPAFNFMSFVPFVCCLACTAFCYFQSYRLWKENPYR